MEDVEEGKKNWRGNDIIALQSQQKGITDFKNCRRYYLKIKTIILLIKNEQKLIDCFA